jgi:hypothetical protein
VRIRGNFEVLILPNPVERVSLLVLDDAGRPLADVELVLSDSAGTKSTAQTDRDGRASIPSARGGACTLEVQGQEVPVYLDPRLTLHTVRVPGLLFAKRASSEFLGYGESA